MIKIDFETIRDKLIDGVDYLIDKGYELEATINDFFEPEEEQTVTNNFVYDIESFGIDPNNLRAQLARAFPDLKL